MNFDLSFLRKSAADLVSGVRDYRGQIERLKREREDIANAPATRDEVKDMLRASIALQAKKYLAGLGDQLTSLARGHNVQADGEVRGINLASTSNATFGPMLLNRALCGLVGPVLYDSLAASVDAMAWPAGSRPLQGRDEAIEQIDKKLKKLIEQEKALVSAAAEVGLRIEDMPHA